MRPHLRATAMPTDDDLVALIHTGSQEALAEMYDRHASAIYATAWRMLGSPADAEEVVQETFLALWNRAGQFDVGRGNARTWLLSIARNRCIDRARAGHTRPPALAFSAVAGAMSEAADDFDDWLVGDAELVAVGSAPASPEEAIVAAENRIAVSSALTALDPLEREVIVLAYHDQLSQSEIAERLGWPIGTVKTRTRRALRNLRGALEEPAVRTRAYAVRALRPADCPAPCA